MAKSAFQIVVTSLTFSLALSAFRPIAFFLSSWDSAFAAGDGDAQLLEEPGPKIRKLYGLGKYDECLQYAEPLALGREKRSAEVQFYYAQLLKRSGRTDEAIAHFEEVLRLAPFGWMEAQAKNNLNDLRAMRERKSKNIDTVGSTRAAVGAGSVAASSRPGEGYVGLAILPDRTIKRAFPGSPAQMANLGTGDTIISIDNFSTSGLSVDQMAERIRGLPGTKVAFVIERVGKRYAVSVVRGLPVSGEENALRRLKSNQPVATGSSGAPASSSALGSATPLGATSSSGPRPTLLASDPQITVLRHTQDTDAVHDILVRTMLKLSPHLRSSMGSGGLKLILAPTLVEALPELVTEKPRGYLHGGGYTNCAGLFRGGENTIYVTERVSHGTYTPQLNTHLEHTFFHEFGHAVDHVQRTSTSEDFVAAYRRDCGHLTNGIRDHFYYFTQEGTAGQSELFAELFADAVEPSGSLNTDEINLTRTFPECFKVVKDLVAVIN